MFVLVLVLVFVPVLLAFTGRLFFDGCVSHCRGGVAFFVQWGGMSRCLQHLHVGTNLLDD